MRSLECPLSSLVLLQVASVKLNEKNIAELKFAEIPVNQVKLMSKDRTTGKFKDRSSIQPESIVRWMTTRPGQVCAPLHAGDVIKCAFGSSSIRSVMFLQKSSALPVHKDLILNVIAPCVSICLCTFTWDACCMHQQSQQATLQFWSISSNCQPEVRWALGFDCKCPSG